MSTDRPSISLTYMSVAVMNAITTIPAGCATTIASCRAVIWLTTWLEIDGSGCVPPVQDKCKSRSPVQHRLPDKPEIAMTRSAPSGRRRTSTRITKGREPEVGGASADVGLPSYVPKQRATALPDLYIGNYLLKLAGTTTKANRPCVPAQTSLLISNPLPLSHRIRRHIALSPRHIQ
jgi:hypothetical protein